MNSRSPVQGSLTLMLAMALSAACGRQPTPQPSSEPVTTAAACRAGDCDAEPVVPPEGTRDIASRGAAASGWERLSGQTLSNVALPLSLILVRHRAIADTQGPFSVVPWHGVVAPSERTRSEALALAEKIAKRASQQPERFPELAREFSEDPTTRARGGSLGTLPAIELYPWPEVLDALQATAVGAVTDPVETPFGFAIFLRRPPLEEETLSGARIIVGHDDAPFLQFSARGALSKRSRGEALQLAEQIYARAKSEPRRFAPLARRLSEHRDAARGGDFGSWSSREPTPWAREVETLRGLAIGETAPPMDTRLGIQIIQRTVNRARKQYAMASLVLRYDPSLPADQPGSRAVVSALARSLTTRLTGDSSEFEALSEQYCCRGARRVIEGREDPALEAALERLTIGQVAREPIESNVSFVIPKRLDLSDVEPQPEVLLDFPTD